MHHNVFTNNPTVPIDVKDRSISELMDGMLKTGFQGRKLAESVQAWHNMLKEKNMTVFMGLSGAMVPAGMRRVISYMIREKMIDCLVSTGANLFHDSHEALGKKHYVGSIWLTMKNFSITAWIGYMMSLQWKRSSELQTT